MRAIESIFNSNRPENKQLISVWIQSQSARLAQLTSGPLLWLGLPLIALVPLLLE
jgi:hypothetical protein